MSNTRTATAAPSTAIPGAPFAFGAAFLAAAAAYATGIGAQYQSNSTAWGFFGVGVALVAIGTLVTIVRRKY